MAEEEATLLLENGSYKAETKQQRKQNYPTEEKGKHFRSLPFLCPSRGFPGECRYQAVCKYSQDSFAYLSISSSSSTVLLSRTDDVKRELERDQTSKN